MSSRQKALIPDLERRLDEWELELQRLGKQLTELRREVMSLKAGERPSPTVFAAPPPPEPAPDASAEAPETSRGAHEPPPPAGTLPEFRGFSLKSSPSVSQKLTSSLQWTPEWETIVGGSWLAKIGIVAVVLGMLYFLKYAFDNQWIGNTGRVLIGAFAGLTLLYGGERFEKKGYRLYGQTLSGGGITILYLSIYAAFNFYHLIAQLPAMLLMAFVTAVCCVLSYRYSSRVLATLGLVGGMLTPYWLRTGTSNQVGLLSYLLILDVGGAWLSRARKWSFLNLISFVGTVILFWGWGERFYRAEDVWVTELFLVLFGILYLALIRDWRSRIPERHTANSLSAGLFVGVVVTLFFFASEVIFFDNPRRFWVFAVVFAALCVAAGLRAHSSRPVFSAFLLCLLGIAPWFAVEYSVADRPVTVAGLTVIWILFLLADPLRNRLANVPPTSSAFALALTNGLIYFSVAYGLLKEDYSGWMGLLALGTATAHLLVARLLPKSIPSARTLALVELGVALTLTTLAVPIQLEQDWVTTAWGLEAVVLIWIGMRTSFRRMEHAGFAVLALCLARLFGWTATQSISDYNFVINKRFLGFLSVTILVVLIALLYHGGRDRKVPVQLFRALVLIACTIFLFGASQETWAYYTYQIDDLTLALDREKVLPAAYSSLYSSLRNTRHLALSLLWGVGSILAVIAGIIWRFRPVRLWGIALFLLAVVKVFVFDIWALQQLYRITSTIGLGFLLLAVAFLYQRFKNLLIGVTGEPETEFSAKDPTAPGGDSPR